MSMIISVCGYDGIVMAADSGASRHVIMSDMKMLFAAAIDKGVQDAILKSHDAGDNLSFCYSDTCEKIHIMQNGIAVSEGGGWLTDGGTITPYLEQFFRNAVFNAPGEAADALLKYVEGLAPDIKTGFHVCGYDPPDEKFGIPIPRVYFVNTLSHEVTSLEKGTTGMMQHAANDSMKPMSQLVANNLKSLTLQDTIDYAVFAIKASAMYEKCVLLNNRIGGHIDVLVIRPYQMEWVSKKRLHVEGDHNDTGIERRLWR
jgi:hypothetical protein